MILRRAAFSSDGSDYFAVVAKRAEAGGVEASGVVGGNRDVVLVADEFVGDFFVRHLGASSGVGERVPLAGLSSSAFP